MKKTSLHIEHSLEQAYDYNAYKELITTLLAEGKSTSEGFGEQFVKYSELGLQRMQRWDKKFELSASQQEKAAAHTEKRIWLVIAEGWCGDAAHSVPVMHKIAQASDNIDFRVVLREKNLELMNDFLTNGGKSIPKLIVYNPDAKTVEATWGPRPAGAKQIFEANRDGEWEVMEQKLQAWYNKDKGQTTAEELMQLLK